MSPRTIPVVLGRSYPLHHVAFACARGWGARAVRRGKLDHRVVCVALRSMVDAVEPVPAPAGLPALPAREAITYELAVAVTADRLAAAQASRDVQKVIAPLLDARATPGQVRRAARAAADGRLDPDELEALLRQEAAWWVRLHAALEAAPAERAPAEVQHAA